MKLVSYFQINLSRFDKVSAAKGLAVVQQKPPVRNVDSLKCQNPFFAKAFSERKVDQRVAGEMIRQVIAVEKSRTVMNVRRSKAAAGKIDHETRAERVALIVIEQKEPEWR